jgi:hypothetical protein
MAKRKKRRSKPNISEEAIERARQQLEDEEDADQSEEEEASEDEPQEQEPSRKRRRRRERKERSTAKPAEVVQYSQISKRKRDELDNEMVEQMLAHPTKFVTEEELREDYHYVITDLRSMGLLAVALLVAIIVLGQLI